MKRHTYITKCRFLFIKVFGKKQGRWAIYLILSESEWLSLSAVNLKIFYMRLAYQRARLRNIFISLDSHFWNATRSVFPTTKYFTTKTNAQWTQNRNIYEIFSNDVYYCYESYFTWNTSIKKSQHRIRKCSLILKIDADELIMRIFHSLMLLIKP